MFSLFRVAPVDFDSPMGPYFEVFSYKKHCPVGSYHRTVRPMNPERASRTVVRRLFILLCGFEILPKTVSTRGLGGRFILSEPVCAYLLDTENGWVLLDAGLNPANGRDPVRIEQKFRSQGFTPPVIRDGHLLEKQFADIGVTFTDVRHVILSHLHYDHCGISRAFRARAHFDSAPGARARVRRESGDGLLSR